MTLFPSTIRQFGRFLVLSVQEGAEPSGKGMKNLEGVFLG